MATTAALDKRLTELELEVDKFKILAQKIIEASEIATKAYRENRLPIDREFLALKTLVDAQVRDLRLKVKKLEGDS